MSHTTSTIPRPPADVLRRLYVDDGLGCPDIAKRYGRDPKTVFWWLRQAGIPTRPRGSNEGRWFKKGGRSLFAGHKHTREARHTIGAATRARDGVPYLRNGEHWLKSAGPEGHPKWKGGVTPERQEFYRSPGWRVACKAVWTRADACCERCGLDYRTVDKRKTPKFHIHHIVSFAVRELRAEPTNLALLCRPCHHWVHGKENAQREFLAEKETA